MHDHIRITWFIANLLHPFLLLLALYTESDFNAGMMAQMAVFVLIAFIASLLLSLPCILLNYACARLSAEMSNGVTQQIITLILLQFIVVYAYGLGLIWLFIGLSEKNVYLLALPAAVAMLLANLFRYKQLSVAARTSLQTDIKQE